MHMKKKQTSTTSFDAETGEVTIINKVYPESQSVFKAKLVKANEQLLIVEESLSNYQAGYNILMEYWNSFPDEEKPKISKRLEDLNL